MIKNKLWLIGLVFIVTGLGLVKTEAHSEPPQYDLETASYISSILNPTPEPIPTIVIGESEYQKALKTKKVAKKAVKTPPNPVSTPAAPVIAPKSDVAAIAKQKSDQAFGEAQWTAMAAIINKESGFNPNAKNPRSTAYGVCQFLDSTWKGTGIAKTSDPSLQLDACMTYVRNRYGTPAAALAFHHKNGWY